MRIVQPHCRMRLSAADFEFITSVLRSEGKAECLISLLSDPEERDSILDDENLFRTLLERNGCLEVSTRFYFYVLVRHVLLRANIDDRSVADYVAEMLAEFASEDRARCHVPGKPDAPFMYFFEMLGALRDVDDRTAFMLRLHIGNYSLFLSGVFPERIRFWAEAKGFPQLSYYEGLGRSQFRMARDHQLAHRYQLTAILDTLADCFSETRTALNDIAERLFSLGDPPSDKQFPDIWRQ